MLFSYSKKLNRIGFPAFEGKVSMLPFDLADLTTLPKQYRTLAEQMLERLPHKIGTAYFTLHGKFLKKTDTLRRGAPHIDGNYLPEVASWGSGGGNGWKVGENGVTLGSKEHAEAYQNENGGMLIASNYSCCKAWNGIFSGDAKEGGDCSHIHLGLGRMLEDNTVYYGNSQFIHESLPADRDVHRVLCRITLPKDHKPEFME